MDHCDTVLNYVWINREAFSSPGAEGDNPVQKRYTDNVLKVADNSPQLTVKLWIDFALLDGAAQEFLTELGTSASNGNLEIHDLREVVAYQQHPVFREAEKPEDEHPVIWKKVDLARLLVLKHVFETTDAENIFYSDFDIVSPPIGACYTKKALDEFGMVFGKIQKPTHGWCLENSFMGFHRGHETFLFEQLIPDSVAAIANDQKNCFWAFRRAVKEKFSEGEQKYLIVPVAQMAGPNSVGICDKVPLPKPDMGVPDDRKASQQPPWFKNSFWGAFFSGG